MVDNKKNCMDYIKEYKWIVLLVVVVVVGLLIWLFMKRKGCKKIEVAATTQPTTNSIGSTPPPVTNPVQEFKHTVNKIR